MVTEDRDISPPASNLPPASKPPVKDKRVEVLVDNLGPDLLTKGTVTDDPKVVALLKKKTSPPLVREVK